MEFGTKEGSYRTVTFFAWMPITLDGRTKWLETVKVGQLYTYDVPISLWKLNGYRWVSYIFVD